MPCFSSIFFLPAFSGFFFFSFYSESEGFELMLMRMIREGNFGMMMDARIYT